LFDKGEMQKKGKRIMKLGIRILKTEHVHFKKIWARKKLFELRKDDRDFQLNDILQLEEINSPFKSKRIIIATVEYILRNFEGLKKGYVIMSINIVEKIRKQG
jgi:hypothetical protein